MISCGREVLKGVGVHRASWECSGICWASVGGGWAIAWAAFVMYIHIYIYICLNFYPFLPSSFFLNNKFYLSLQVLLLGLGFFDSLFSVLSPIPLGVSQQLWCLATWRVKPQQSLWPIWPECVNAALMWMLW